MTDAQVNAEVAAAKRALKSSETRARKKYSTAKAHALRFFDRTYDVDRASQENAIRRAEITEAAALKKAQEAYARRLASVRAQAGEWIDLVPDSPQLSGGKRRHATLGGVKKPRCKHGAVKSGPRKGLCRRKPRQVLSAAAKRELRAINRMLRKR